MVQNGYGDHSYGSGVRMRRLVKQRGYGKFTKHNLIKQRGYGKFTKQNKNYYIYIRRRRQRGHGIGSIFRNIFKMIKPVLKTSIKAAKPLAKKALKYAKPLVKKAAKYGVKHGMSTITDIANDVIDGKNLKHAFKEQTNKTFKKGENDLIKKFNDFQYNRK